MTQVVSTEYSTQCVNPSESVVGLPRFLRRKSRRNLPRPGSPAVRHAAETFTQLKPKLRKFMGRRPTGLRRTGHRDARPTQQAGSVTPLPHNPLTTFPIYRYKRKTCLKINAFIISV